MMKNVMGAQVVPGLWRESVSIAFSSLRRNKFRTFLSLLGVSIGIFTIVTVFCVIDAMKNGIKGGMATLGWETVLIQKEPWEIESSQNGYQWWEYEKRREIGIQEYEFLKENMTTASSVVYFSSQPRAFSAMGRGYSDGYLLSITPDYDKLLDISIAQGRNFTFKEGEIGSNVAIIGSEVARGLFPSGDAVGSEMSIDGYRVSVIGVAASEGESVMSIMDLDCAVIVPMEYGRGVFGVDKVGGTIMISPMQSVAQSEMIEQATRLLRGCRRVNPEERDDFSFNKMTYLAEQVEEVMGVVSMAGWIIGGFSLLIGGFGIANMMFVSVKERRREIGIQKALGARRSFIMVQFLVESAILSFAGGGLGILLVIIISLFLENNLQFPYEFTFMNGLRGVMIALGIGVCAGFIPAYNGSGEDPAKAMNS